MEYDERARSAAPSLSPSPPPALSEDVLTRGYFDAFLGWDCNMLEPYVAALDGFSEESVWSRPRVKVVPDDFIRSQCAGARVLAIGSYLDPASLKAIAEVAREFVVAVHGLVGLPDVFAHPNIRVVDLRMPRAALAAVLPLKWTQFGDLYSLLLRVGKTHPNATPNDKHLHKFLSESAGELKRAFILSHWRILQDSVLGVPGPVRTAFALAGEVYTDRIRRAADEFVYGNTVSMTVADKRVLAMIGPPTNVTEYTEAVARAARAWNAKSDGIPSEQYVAAVNIRQHPSEVCISAIAVTPGGVDAFLAPPLLFGGSPAWVGKTLPVGSRVSQPWDGQSLEQWIEASERSLERSRSM
jgi:hypothetical protein